MACLICKEEKEKISLYIGKKARTSFDRESEHLSAMRWMDEASPLVEHHLQEHSEEEEPRFSMEVVKYQTSNLMRQAEEADQIMRHEGHNLLKTMCRGPRGR